MRANKENTATIDRSVSLMLRGVAILTVVFSHYTEWMFLPSPYPRVTHFISTLGPVGVDMFFAISGYGLYMSAVTKNTAPADRSRFLLRRLSNFYIPYVIIASAINICMGGSMFSDRVVLFNILTGGDYWFVRVLLVFYIFFAAAFMILKKLRIIALTLMVIAYTIYLHKSGYRDFWTLSNLSFVLGCMTAALCTGYNRLWSRHAFRGAAAVVAAGLTIAAGMLMIHNGGSGKASAYCYEFAANMFFTVFVLSAATFIKCRKWPVLTALGESSLFQYLLHTIIFCRFIEWFEGAGYILSMLMAALSVMGISLIMFKLYRLSVSKLMRPLSDRMILTKRRKQ